MSAIYAKSGNPDEVTDNETKAVIDILSEKTDTGTRRRSGADGIVTDQDSSVEETKAVIDVLS